jgi:CBS domain-containing protein
MRVKDLMTARTITVGPTDSLLVARALMERHHIRHLPVVNNHKLVGILSEGDVLAAVPHLSSLSQEESARELGRLPVERIATKRTVSISPMETLSRAANVMRERKVECLPVVENTVLVGMLTNSDLLAHMGRHSR